MSVLGGKLKKPSAMKTNSVMNGEAMPCFTSSGGRRASRHVFVLEPSGWIFTSRLSTCMSTKSSPVCSLAHGIYCAKSRQDTNHRFSHNPKPWCTFELFLWLSAQVAVTPSPNGKKRHLECQGPQNLQNILFVCHEI